MAGQQGGGMSTDRELLELAAKALDNPKIRWNGAIWCNCERMNPSDAHGNRYPSEWNPLTDDGDALRLASKLNFQVDFGCPEVTVTYREGYLSLGVGFDAFGAARRAIVLAAAEIGKAMP
jgi:hypothetical protein